MKLLLFDFLLCCALWNYVIASASEEEYDADQCCSQGEMFARTNPGTSKNCLNADPPDGVEPESEIFCLATVRTCCETHYKQKEDCEAGIKLAASKQCRATDADIGKNCCEECAFGRLTGESQGKEACGPPAGDDVSPTSALRNNAFRQCCLEAARIETTTEELTTQRTTTEPIRDVCKNSRCDHICVNEKGKPKCTCNPGYRLASDNKSCTDINECAESDANLCTVENTVCHNTPGAYKCVPLKKRDVGLTCPRGFKRNIRNQVCDDINECQLPRPPCPKYLCENTIGAYKCAGKLGTPATEEGTGSPAIPSVSTTSSSPKDDMCPPGFRAGTDDECVDIDECTERSDDCQRLSQHCINTHGTFFCQDHVSKRCAPGFKVNAATGVCEDIDECEESSEVCKRNEICVNLPGAYNCKSKISTLPRLSSKTCQEGTRIRPGGSNCEDIDECREGTHLCDQFQNCINTFGGHECRCKNGFELDSNSRSCIDIDECALKLDNCGAGLHCLNVLGSFTCTRRLPSSSTTLPPYEYEEYDVDENDSETSTNIPDERITVTERPTTQRPTTTTERRTTKRPVTTRRPSPRQPASTTRPVTTVTTRIPTTVSPTTTRRPRPTRPRYPFTNKPPTARTTFRPTYRPTTITAISTATEPEANTEPNFTGSDGNTDFHPNFLHCLDGYERNERGECVDTNECLKNKYICGSTEVCKNFRGSYACDCAPGYQRDNAGWCVSTATTTTTPPTTTPPTTTPPTTPPPTNTPVTPYDNAVTDEITTGTSPDGWSYTPTRPSRPYNPPLVCELGYRFDGTRGRCVDIDECATGRAKCSQDERCSNTEGGYRCVCAKQRCLPTPESYTPNHAPPQPNTNVAPNVITVGSQYGQRGPLHQRASYSHTGNGAVLATCPWGYKLTHDKFCQDIDECTAGTSTCGPDMRCENFYGGYSCQCPAGHRLDGDHCVDVDECTMGQPCSIHGRCVNTVGSYRCFCGTGFRNAPANDKVCHDIDECAENNVCQQGCINVWGGYRCTCERGYRLHADNRTCVDVDECAEWGSRRGRLCVGQCLNVAGSFRCDCPKGYRLAEDGRSCVDIDECETGAASCAGGGDPSVVCQNTRGGYHCHRIACPSGYRLEDRHRCNRIQRSCPMSDWTCLRQPGTYSYNFITFVSNLYLPSGSVDLFTMHGPSWTDSTTRFDLAMLDAQSSSTQIKPADISCFDVRAGASSCVVSLRCPLRGPQVTELELTMSLQRRGQFAGSAVARLVLIVSEYEF